VLYLTAFVLLAMMQFTKYNGFIKRIGNLEISGQYRKDSEDAVDSFGVERTLTGRLSIVFNGMEFDLGKSVVYSDGEKTNIQIEGMTVSDNSASFRSREVTLTFLVKDDQALIVSANIDNLTELEIPYKPLKTARIQNNNGQFIVISDKGSYTFGNARISSERQSLILTGRNPSASYMMLPDVESVVSVSESSEESVFDPNDFVIENGHNKTAFNAAVDQWRDKIFPLWSRTATIANDEKQIVAYESEALARGVYRQSRVIPMAFLNGTERTFVSSVFFGRTDIALRSITSDQRDTANRLSQQINGKSFDFFKESHPIEWLSIRGYTKSVDSAGEWILLVDPSTVVPDNAPGILEGYADWSAFRPDRDNPFSKFSIRVLSLVSAGIRKSANGEYVFVFNGGVADMEFNIRLGKALVVFAEITGNEGWANAGRSIILSVLSLTDERTGMVPKELLVSEISTDTPNLSAGANGVSAAILYGILRVSENYPHAVQIVPGAQPIWVWTASSSVTTALITNNMLDISVSFPQDETHYMLIRGIRPGFIRLQLYDRDYRTASDFERWDSSGWSYSTSEQTLLVKMKHRTREEHIQIFW
jgi:hypothetical protein